MKLNKNKKILIVNLSKGTFESKTMIELNKYIGGISLGLKLYEIYAAKDPLIFAVGPLNGFFPYASKTAIVLNNSGVMEDVYVGGALSTRIAFAGYDAIVLLGKSKEEVVLDIKSSDVSFLPENTDLKSLGLPGKRCLGEIKENGVVIDGLFTVPESFLLNKAKGKNVSGFVVTGSETYSLENFARYKKLYSNLLSLQKNISVNPAGAPSCSNCPVGCVKAREGELGGNVLLHSLVACEFSETIYSDIGIVFSCLNTLGYEYRHEDLEALPTLVEQTLKNLTNV
jgi:aldehyde:ferredoxin oxidoreductase